MESPAPPQLGCPPGEGRGTRQPFEWWRYAIPGVVLAALLVSVFFWFDPGQNRFFPPCLFHTLTGWQCPGCGGQRAAHQLLHGNLAAAFRLNPLIFLVLGLLGLWFLRAGWPRLRGLPPKPVISNPRVAWGLVLLVALFTVLRNFNF